MNATILVLSLILTQQPQVKFPTYAQGVEFAKQVDRPLVVFAGVPPRQVPGFIAVAEPTGFMGASRAGIMLHKGGWDNWFYRHLSDAEIHAFYAREVRPSADPFLAGSEPLYRPLNAAPPDADEWLRGLRSESLKVTLRGMERYSPARFTQHPLSRTYRFAGAPFFHHVARESMERKWLVGGGLEHVRGWSNVLLRDKSNEVKQWVDHIDPADQISEIVHQRSYVRAKFADVLLNADGEVFEVRMAVKVDGRWDRFVAEHHADRVPRGYRRLSPKECVDCHKQAGTGAYATAYIPGGDTVLSEPLEGFER